jgi:hypothetical protein
MKRVSPADGLHSSYVRQSPPEQIPLVLARCCKTTYVVDVDFAIA